MYIDKQRCKLLISAIRDYRKEYDSKLKVYKNRPLHDHNSHACDALRYLCISLPKLRVGLTSEQIDRNYKSAMYGEKSNMPDIFRDDLTNY